MAVLNHSQSQIEQDCRKGRQGQNPLGEVLVLLDDDVVLPDVAQCQSLIDEDFIGGAHGHCGDSLLLAEHGGAGAGQSGACLAVGVCGDGEEKQEGAEELGATHDTADGLRVNLMMRKSGKR